MSDYRKLGVWQKACDLAVDVYKATGNFPKEEMFGQISQIRRAATSVPANIAEGAGRGSRADYVRFLYIAMGSINELETHLVIAQRLGYLSPEPHQQLEGQITEVRRMLSGLINSMTPRS
ncbi:MAG: four helix bundle protein [Anaerolineae bacterium]